MTKDTAKFIPYFYQHVQWPWLLVGCVNIVVVLDEVQIHIPTFFIWVLFLLQSAS
jgi:hypothetical protein